MKNIDSRKLDWFNQLFNSSHIAILIVDKNRKNLLVNNQLCEMFGYNNDELIGVSAELLHVCKQSYDEFAIKAFNLVREGKPISLDYKFKRKGGTCFWGHISGDMIKKHDEVLWTIVDITRRTELTFELQKKEKQFLAINKLINLGHWEYDLDSKMVKISDEMCRLLGLKNTNSISYHGNSKLKAF
jgi:PAS domain S-box-containing protein